MDCATGCEIGRIGPIGPIHVGAVSDRGCATVLEIARDAGRRIREAVGGDVKSDVYSDALNALGEGMGIFETEDDDEAHNLRVYTRQGCPHCERLADALLVCSRDWSQRDVGTVDGLAALAEEGVPVTQIPVVVDPWPNRDVYAGTEPLVRSGVAAVMYVESLAERREGER